MRTPADHFSEAARSALASRAQLFTPAISVANPQDAAPAIAAIETQGWTLTNWAVAVDPHGQPTAYPVFRAAYRSGMQPA